MRLVFAYFNTDKYKKGGAILKALKKIVHILANICYVLIGVYVLVCIPLLFKFKPLVVLTGSMEPTYKVGSVIYYKETGIDNINENDVITFKTKNGTVVTHRVYAKNNDIFTTKGDANDSPDVESVSYDNVLGKVSKISVPYIGHYVNFLKHNMMFVISIVVILLLEFILSNIKSGSEKGGEINEKEE